MIEAYDAGGITIIICYGIGNGIQLLILW